MGSTKIVTLQIIHPGSKRNQRAKKQTTETAMASRFTVSPVPAAKKQRKHKKGKRSKKSHKKKPVSHKMKLFKGRRNRHGRTIAQVVLIGIHAFGSEKGATFTQLKKFLKHADVNVSNFVLKKVLKKMTMRKVLSCPKGYYLATGKSLPTSSKNRRKRATHRTKKSDRKFRNKLRREARKIARGGRTVERVVFDIMSPGQGHKRQSFTFNQVKASMKKDGITCTNFVLVKVMGRLRSKKLVKIEDAHNTLTGKKFFGGRSK